MVNMTLDELVIPVPLFPPFINNSTNFIRFRRLKEKIHVKYQIHHKTSTNGPYLIMEEEIGLKL